MRTITVGHSLMSGSESAADHAPKSKQMEQFSTAEVFSRATRRSKGGLRANPVACRGELSCKPSAEPSSLELCRGAAESIHPRVARTAHKAVIIPTKMTFKMFHLAPTSNENDTVFHSHSLLSLKGGGIGVSGCPKWNSFPQSQSFIARGGKCSYIVC